MNPSFFPEFESDFKKLRLIHFSLVMGLAVFITVVLNFAVEDTEAVFEFMQTESLLGVGIGLTGILASIIIFNQRLKTVDQIKKQKARFDHLQTNHIISWALLEAAALFNVVLYLTYANGINILAGTLVTGVLLYSRPKKEWIQQKLIIE